jgi:hypothetical protein
MTAKVVIKLKNGTLETSHLLKVSCFTDAYNQAIHYINDTHPNATLISIKLCL